MDKSIFCVLIFFSVFESVAQKKKSEVFKLFNHVEIPLRPKKFKKEYYFVYTETAKDTMYVQKDLSYTKHGTFRKVFIGDHEYRLRLYFNKSDNSSQYLLINRKKNDTIAKLSVPNEKRKKKKKPSILKLKGIDEIIVYSKPNMNASRFRINNWFEAIALFERKKGGKLIIGFTSPISNEESRQWKHFLFLLAANDIETRRTLETEMMYHVYKRVRER